MSIYQKIQDDIATQVAKGHMAIFSIFSDPQNKRLAFAYTVGLTSLGLPEIIISGNMNPRFQHALIEHLAGLYKERGAFFGVSHELLADGLRVELVEVDCAASADFGGFIIQASNYYRGTDRAVRLVQIRWPDAQGRLPDEEGFDMADKQDLLPRLTH